MKLAGRIRKAAAGWVAKQLSLMGVDTSRGWVTLFSSNGVGFQTDTRVTQESIIAFSPVYACVTLIASDVGKICLRLMTQKQGVWIEAENSAAFSPVLRKPNHYQTRQQFIETWTLSKQLSGNTYVLKVRDNRKVVTALYVLDPNRVTPLVAPDGAVYYRVNRDDLSKVPSDQPAIPASEIIHDRMECLFHPLVGISPLFAATLSATQGLRIQNNSERFFRNHSQPGGMLTAPETIDDATALRLKTEFEANYSGEKIGRLFVAGDGLEYKPLAVTAENSQLVEQLKLSAEQACSVFHVPAYMIGVGQPPSYDNVEALNQQYFTQCLQKLYNAIEDLLDDGLGLAPLGYRTEFDLADLLRMDSLKQAEVLEKLSARGFISPDEGRATIGRLPTPGGSSPLIQIQNASLAAIAKRDAKEDPFATAKPPADPAPDADQKAALETARLIAALTKGLEHV